MNNEEKEVANFDQAMAEIVRTVPSGLFSLFSAFNKEGFTEEQSLILTIEWFKGMFMRPQSPNP